MTLSRAEWRLAALIACLAAFASLVWGVNSTRGLEAQLAATSAKLRVARVALDSAGVVAAGLRRERQAARDSAAVEQVLRDSLYRLAAARRADARRWREVVASLQSRSVVDSLPLLEQVTIYRDEADRLRAAGDLTAVSLELQSATIARLEASDRRERQRADEANARALEAEGQLEAQLMASRAAVLESLQRARRPWYRRAGTAVKERAGKLTSGGLGFLLGKLT